MPIRKTMLARALRRESTDAERVLWRILRGRGLAHAKFRRQHPVGAYIADFARVEVRLIVEVDGGQHVDSAGDARRSEWLAAQGWRVLRFWNNEVLGNPGGVAAVIRAGLAAAPTTPSPPQR